MGIVIALAIALHNIPEGVAVAMPIYYATKSRARALWYSFIAGMAEPLGALVVFAFLYKYLDDSLLHYILATVAGIMVFISFDELLPRAFSQKNVHPIIAGVFFGMALTAFGLYLM